MKKNLITKAFLSTLTLASFTIQTTPTATFTTDGWQSALNISLNSPIDLTTQPITFTVAPHGISMTKGVWGIPEAPTTVTQSGDRVTVNVGTKWWPTSRTEHYVTNQPFSLKFSPSFTELSISDLFIGNTPVPVTNPDALMLPANANPKNGYYLQDSSKNYPPLPFAPYTDITQLSGKPLVQAMAQNNLQAIRFAFITEGGKLPGLNWGGYPLSFFTTQIQYLQNERIKVIVSLGGEVGIFPGITNGDFYTQLEDVIKSYPGVGLCFDIEGKNVTKMLTPNSQGTGTQADALMQAAARLQKTHAIPINITLATLPTGLTSEGKAIVTAAKNAGLIFDVNIMAMDYGDKFDVKPFNMKDYAIAAANNTASFLQTLYPEKRSDECLHHVQVTVMIGYNDITAEVFSLKDAQELGAWAHDHGVILSMWSFTRDHAAATSDELVSQKNSGPQVQTADYQFTAIFNQ